MLRAIHRQILHKVSAIHQRNFVKAVLANDNVLTCTKKVEIPPKNVNLFSFVTEKFSSYGDKIATVDDVTGNSVTYNQLLNNLQNFVSALSKIGFGKGDKLAVVSPNCPEYVYALLCPSALGGMSTTLNPASKANEIIYQLESSGANVIFANPTNASLAMECAKKLGIDKVIVNDLQSNIELDGVMKLSEILDDDGKAFPQGDLVSDLNDLSLLPYSSGTTGLPKGVMLSHHAIATNIRQTEAFMPDRHVMLANLPFFHIYGIVVSLLTNFHYGRKIITQDGFEPHKYLSSIQKHKVDNLNLVPPLVLFLAKHPVVDEYDFSTVKCCTSGGAPCGQELIDQFMARFPHVEHFYQGYGLTETGPVAVFQTKGNVKSGSIGIPVPNTEIKVVDLNSGKALKANDSGEVCVRGPQNMNGYLNNEEATKNTIKADGWLHTGDIGYYDEEGHFFIVDRLKELIKYKAFQVPPAELEGLLLSHPLITDAGVIGIPDEKAGELPKAFVVKKPESSLTEKDVIEFVKEHVSSHKQLRGGVTFIEIIPKSPSGKILRRELRNI